MEGKAVHTAGKELAPKDCKPFTDAPAEALSASQVPEADTAEGFLAPAHVAELSSRFSRCCEICSRSW